MTQLSKTLGPLSGTAMMLNTVLGAGILILPGIAAAQVGAMSLWTWISCAAASIPLLATFAILASRYPEAGGVGHIAKAAFGSLGHVITSALFLGAVCVGVPSIALTAGYYIARVVDFPPWLSAFVLISIAGLMNLALPGTASKIGTWIAAAVIAFLAILVGASALTLIFGGDVPGTLGLPAPTLDLFTPFMLVFFAFTGWEVAIGTSEEFRNPQSDVPKSIAFSFIITVLFYVACSSIIVAAGSSAFVEAPFLAILAPDSSSLVAALIALGTAGLLTANLFAAIWAVSRMVFSLSRENLLPTFLSRTRNGTPWTSVIATSVTFISVAAFDGLGILDIGVLFAVAGQNFLLIYAVSACALLVVGKGIFDRATSVVSIVIAAVLIYLSGVHVIYPLALIITGILVLLLRNVRLSKITTLGPGV